MIYKVVIEPRAILDLQEAIDYYDAKQIGLGEYFYQVVEEHIEAVTKSHSFKLDTKIITVFPFENFLLFSFIILMKNLKPFI
jgi:hypothetical protein